jgi:RNA polymerase sigma factor (sigma-70 family)
MGVRRPAPRTPLGWVPGSSVPPEARVELARTAGRGDATATRALLDVVAPRVLGAVRAVMGAGHPDADDACQLALIGLIQALPNFRGECDPAQFAARIAVRTATAARRRARSRGLHEDGSVDIDDIERSSDGLAAARRRAQIRSLLDALPDEQAESLALRVMLGWSLKEIALISGAPLNTVRSRLRLAKEALRQRIARDPTLAEALDLGEDR